MPLFMDVHENMPEGAGAKDVADAHAADVATQEKYGVNYKQHWVDEAQRKIFCLVEAPGRRDGRPSPSRGPRPRGRPHLRGAGRRVTAAQEQPLVAPQLPQT
jgi:Protein of unknown function (DUF4242)